MRKAVVVTAALALLCMVGIQCASAAPVQWSVDSGGNGHLYEAVCVPASIMWSTANDAARSAGGYLATATSELENEFIYELISDDRFWLVAVRTNAGPWIGGYQDPEAGDYSEPGGGWRWVTDEPFAYTDWAPLQPDNGNVGEDRLHFFGWEDAKTPQWNDVPDMEVILGYVVEYDQAPVPETSGLFALLSGLAGLGRMWRGRKSEWRPAEGQ